MPCHPLQILLEATLTLKVYFLGICRYSPVVLNQTLKVASTDRLLRSVGLSHQLLWPEWLARSLFKLQSLLGNWCNPQEIWRQYLLITTRPTQPRLSRTWSSWTLPCLEGRLGWAPVCSTFQNFQKVWAVCVCVCVCECTCACLSVVIFCQTPASCKSDRIQEVTPRAHRIEVTGTVLGTYISTGARNRLWGKEGPKANEPANKTVCTKILC